MQLPLTIAGVWAVSDKEAPPPFRPVARRPTAETPEALFYLLPRTSSHGYLRGPQQDVLREYASPSVTTPDVAFELPTGTGKTAVGLLIAEWRRRTTGQRAAYLCLTNQLAKQAVEEARRLGIVCADVTGNRDQRDPGEEGRYRDASAVAISTYANFFNVNPVIREGGVVVLDDAHGGDQIVAHNWTVRVRARELPEMYDELLAVIRPSLTGGQLRAIRDPSENQTVEIVDLPSTPGWEEALTNLLDDCPVDVVKYPWHQIRNHLQACVVLASYRSIVIRPVIPPTHSHEPFRTTALRVYMSATLGGSGDICRAYGIDRVRVIRAAHPQWGRRFVFIPGLYAAPETALEIVGKVWDDMQPRRATLLTPSNATKDKWLQEFGEVVAHSPVVMSSADIQGSLGAFHTPRELCSGVAGTVRRNRSSRRRLSAANPRGEPQGDRGIRAASH